MSKKPDIGAKEFTKLLEPFNQKPNKALVKKLDSKMFPLDQNKVFNFKPEYLAIKEFSRCLSLFEKRNVGVKIEEAPMRMDGVQQLITEMETPHREKLQQLAIDTIREVYQVPDYVDLRGMIYPRLNLDTEQDTSPEPFLELSLVQKNNMRDEIQKRIILNGLVHGSSMHIWKGMYHLVSAELDQIDSELKEYYDYYTSTLGILIWTINPQEFEEMMGEADTVQGFNKLKFNKDFGGQVEAKGINFPVLLHELNKGVMDWLISAAIPAEYSEQELTYYYAKSDSYENELYHYLLSPTLWLDLLETAQLENHQLPKLISRLTKMTYQQLTFLFRLIQNNKALATEQIKEWQIS